MRKRVISKVTILLFHFFLLWKHKWQRPAFQIRIRSKLKATSTFYFGRKLACLSIIRNSFLGAYRFFFLLFFPFSLLFALQAPLKAMNEIRLYFREWDLSDERKNLAVWGGLPRDGLHRPALLGQDQQDSFCKAKSTVFIFIFFKLLSDVLPS